VVQYQKHKTYQSLLLFTKNIDEKIAPIILYKDGEPCTHLGCSGHTKHPCEVCGRFNAIGDVFKGVK